MDTGQSGLNLYVYGSCESDQYYHPKGENQSRKPICLTALPSFVQDAQSYPNPLQTEQVARIACGALHSLVLTTTGKVYSFGCNDEGALGREGSEKVPLQVELDELVDLIAAGDNHSLFANSASGAVYFTGNYKYLRGEKMAEPIRKPIKFHLAEIHSAVRQAAITKVVSGANHSCILAGGKVFCRGQPQAFTTGRRINQRRKTQSSLIFQGVGLSGVVDVWCGGYHSIVKTEKMKYYAWGTNIHGQLGINSFTSQIYPVEIRKIRGKNVVNVACGTNFSIFLMEDGSVWGCGQNQYGQLGKGKQYVYEEEEEIGEDEGNEEVENKMSIEGSLLKNESPIEQIRNRSYYIKSIIPIQLQQKITGIGCGSQFSFAWSATQLYSWGFGMNYVLLNGEQEDQYDPFKVRSKIINQEKIHDLKAGAQHVLYLSHRLPWQQPPTMSNTVRERGMQSRKRLSRRRRK